jgi:regulator of sigma D
MVNGRFNNDDVEQLFNRFIVELNERWDSINISPEQRLLNFDDVYNAAAIRHPQIRIFEPASIELRNAVESRLIASKRIEFVKDRQIRRIN